ncbi:hypothetical protein Mapa_000825 [Marchantia paleacea]|nr:hypothetical protein Mapa_000825 [Marchantia paleacea]
MCSSRQEEYLQWEHSNSVPLAASGIQPGGDIIQHLSSDLVELTLEKRMKSTLIQFDGFIFAGCRLIELLASFGVSDVIFSAMEYQKRHRHPPQILVQEVANPLNLQHRLHPRGCSITPGIAENQLPSSRISEHIRGSSRRRNNRPLPDQTAEQFVARHVGPGHSHGARNADQRCGENDPVPALGILEMHEQSHGAAHRFSQQKPSEPSMRRPGSDGAVEAREGSCRDVEALDVTGQAPRSAEARHVCGVGCVAPLRQGDGEELERPGAIGPVAVRAADHSLGGLVQWQPRLREERPLRAFEMLPRVLHPLRRVVLVLRHVPPHVRHSRPRSLGRRRRASGFFRFSAGEGRPRCSNLIPIRIVLRSQSVGHIRCIAKSKIVSFHPITELGIDR